MNGHDDYIQSTNDELEIQEQEELNESIRATEEDHDLDHASLNRPYTTTLNGRTATEKEELEMKQYSELLSQSAKEAYKHLYNMGLNKEQVREKLDYLARFLGEFATSRLSAEQWGHINMWLKDLETLQVKL
jgi:ribosomal protein L33